MSFAAFDIAAVFVCLICLVYMLRNVGCSVLVEGVETAEQVEILRRLGIDFFQGYYFAKPMPKGDFVAHLQ